MPIEVDIQQPRWRAVDALSLYCASRTTTNPPGKIQRASDHAATGCNVLDCFNTPHGRGWQDTHAWLSPFCEGSTSRCSHPGAADAANPASPFMHSCHRNHSLG